MIFRLQNGHWLRRSAQANGRILDFPRIAREDFDLNGIEFVNTLFESPTETYLKKLKQNANDHGVTMVLIMVDEEGDGCADTKEASKQFEINHRKWVDIAHFLGCHAIRTNCRGPENVDKKEALEVGDRIIHNAFRVCKTRKHQHRDRKSWWRVE